nr:hypothetical protein [Streptomyces subrutilus]
MIYLILAWTYLVNDEKISSIGCYVRDQLGPRLGELVWIHSMVVSWEVCQRNVPGRTMRKQLRTTVDLITYLVLPMVGTTASWCSPTVQSLFALASLTQTLALGVLSWQFLRHAGRGEPAGAVPRA